MPIITSDTTTTPASNATRQIIPAVIETVQNPDGTSRSVVYPATSPRGRQLLTERANILHSMVGTGVPVQVSVPTSQAPQTDRTPASEPQAA